MIRRLVAHALVVVLVLGASSNAPAQTIARRLTTLDALRQYPGYFHLQNILLRGEFAVEGTTVTLRADGGEMRVLLDNVAAPGGVVDVRAHLIDVGRLDPEDPRVASYAERRGASTPWPRPGEELLLNVNGVIEAQREPQPTVRALALEPWRFEGQTVTVLGNFRGRNLFGDLADAPSGRGRYDFVLRGVEGAVWVTGQRPRGRGFDFDVDRRLDTNKWLSVTGVVSRVRGLVILTATGLELADAPALPAAEPDPIPPPPPLPAEVIFSTPTEAETDVARTSVVRIQFSRGLRENSIAEGIRVSYLGAQPGSVGPAFTTAYDGASRALEIRFAEPLEPFRTVRVELLEGVTAFDGAPVLPWTLTFSIAD